MSDFQPAPTSDAPASPMPAAEPTAADFPGVDFGQQSAAPTPPGATSDGAADAPASHPVWEKRFDEVGIPEMLRPKLMEAIRADEAAVQRQIEAARGTVPPEWQDFLTEARQEGVTPAELVSSFNAFDLLRRDPLGFQQQLNANIEQMVASGQLTRAQGDAAQERVQDRVDDITGLEDPTAKELADLKAKIEAREAREQQEEQQRQAEQQEQELAQFYDSLLNESGTIVGSDPRFAALKGTQGELNAQINAARIADSLLQSGQVRDPMQALKMGVEQIASMIPQAPAAPRPPALPVQGGSSSVPASQVTKMTDEQREAAMIAEAMRMAASE